MKSISNSGFIFHKVLLECIYAFVFAFVLQPSEWLFGPQSLR